MTEPQRSTRSIPARGRPNNGSSSADSGRLPSPERGRLDVVLCWRPHSVGRASRDRPDRIRSPRRLRSPAQSRSPAVAQTDPLAIRTALGTQPFRTPHFSFRLGLASALRFQSDSFRVVLRSADFRQRNGLRSPVARVARRELGRQNPRPWLRLSDVLIPRPSAGRGGWSHQPPPKSSLGACHRHCSDSTPSPAVAHPLFGMPVPHILRAAFVAAPSNHPVRAATVRK
jgi:hypothetical protein